MTTWGLCHLGLYYDDWSHKVYIFERFINTLTKFLMHAIKITIKLKPMSGVDSGIALSK